MHKCHLHYGADNIFNFYQQLHNSSFQCGIIILFLKKLHYGGTTCPDFISNYNFTKQEKLQMPHALYNNFLMLPSSQWSTMPSIISLINVLHYSMMAIQGFVCHDQELPYHTEEKCHPHPSLYQFLS